MYRNAGVILGHPSHRAIDYPQKHLLCLFVKIINYQRTDSSAAVSFSPDWLTLVVSGRYTAISSSLSSDLHNPLGHREPPQLS